MINTHRIVDEIRVFLQGADRTNSPRLKELAQRYATACAEANERLSRCLYFLRQGLRGEAIHLADTAPPIMEVFAILDFPERAEWEELALAYDWASGIALALDSAQALNEAYAQEDPLRELMRTHRLLAMSRAPVAQRLATLRKIAQVDTNNSIWQDDIRIFEKARLAQLADDIRRTVAAVDLPGATAIAAEMAAPDWLEKPTTAQQEAAKAALDSIRRSVARSSLAALLPRLLDTIGTADLAAAQAVRARWQTLAREAALARNDPLADRAQPALDWIAAEEQAAATEDAYQQAVRDIEEALDAGAPLAVIEQLERAVWDMERDAPKHVEARISQRQQGQVRQTRMVIIGSAGALTAVLLLVGWIAWWFHSEGNKKRGLEQTIVQIKEDLKKGDVKGARQAYRALVKRYPDVAESPTLSEQATRLETAEKQEETRARQFQEALKKAQAQTAPAEDGPEIKDLRALARGPDETAAVERLAGAARDALAKARADTDGQVRTLVAKYAPRVGALEDAVKKAPLSQETVDDLRILKEGVGRIKPLLPLASETRKQAEELITRVEAAAVLQALRDKQAGLEKSITATIRAGMTTDALDLYVKNCRSYRTEFPDAPRSADFGKALAQTELWKAIIAWNEMVAEWGGKLNVDEPVEANARLRQIRDFQAQAGRSFQDPAVADYQALLNAFVRSCDGGDSGPRGELTRYFNDKLLDPVWKVATDKGKVYYGPKEPQPNSSGLSIDYFRDRPAPGLMNTKRFTIPKEMGLHAPVKAPQSVIAVKAKGILSRMSATTDAWERALAEILRLIRDNHDLDPVFQVAMLSRVMNLASSGSFGMQQTLKDSLQTIKDADLDLNTRWMDPDDNTAPPVRSKARTLLTKLPSLSSLSEDALRAREDVIARVYRTYLPVGWLCRDDGDGDAWRCLGPGAPRSDDDLWIITPEKTWARVGQGSAVDPSAGSALLVEGRLVFARRRAL